MIKDSETMTIIAKTCFISETKYDGTTTWRGAEAANAWTECWNAAADGSYLQWEWTSHSGNCHTQGHHKGKNEYKIKK